MAADQAIAALASRQQGNVSRAQLLALGIGRGAIDHRIATGRLHRRHQGVYLVGHDVSPRFGDEMAAVLACGDGAVLSHRSAPEVFELAERRKSDVDVSIPSRSTRRRPGIRVHRAPALDRRDTGFSHDIPITSPARTLLDFATQAQPPRARARALVQRLVTKRALAALLARHRAPRHTPDQNLLDDDGGPTLTRSDAEELMLALARSARLPRPEVCARLHGYEVDFLRHDRKLVVEVDSGRRHGNAAALERDHRKNGAPAGQGLHGAPLHVQAGPPRP